MADHRERLRAAIIVLASALASAARAQSISAAEGSAPRGAVSSRTLVWAYSYGPGGYEEFGPVKAIDEKYDPEGRLVSWTLSCVSGDKALVVERGARTYAGTGRGYEESVTDGEGRAMRSVAAALTAEGWRITALSPAGTTLYEAIPISTDGSSLSFEYLMRGRDGSPSFIGADSFSPEGRPLVSRRFAEDGKLAYASGYSYRVLDSRGNWTERYEWERYVENWDRPKSKALRVISYAGSGK
jgi:hypothetical protein